MTKIGYNDNMLFRNIFIRNIDADDYQEIFLVTAIASIFVIRIFLRLTHYPQLGNGAFHIAHMLWGGFFMLAAMIIMFTFLGKRALYVASVLGGIGFGTFIDELGKFITSDNNYFYRPAIAFIYMIFVLLYLLLKFIPRYQQINQREYLVNALELIKDSAINDLDADEKRQALRYLKHCDQKDPIVISLTKLIHRMDTVPVGEPGVLTRIGRQIERVYLRAAQSGLLMKITIVYLSYETLRIFLQAVGYFVTRPLLPLNEWGKLYSSILAGIFVLIGLSALKFSRFEAYRFFRISMLIIILLTEFFAFMRTQWLELIPLAANLFMLVVINYAMSMERRKAQEAKLER
jgi:hypothetical protein